MRSLFFLSLCLAMVLLSACDDREKQEAEIQTLIEQNVEERIAEYRRIILERCYQEVLDSASSIVDSILIVEARMTLDTTGRPPKPEKPEKPEIKTMEDTIPLRPLLKKDTND